MVLKLLLLILAFIFIFERICATGVTFKSLKGEIFRKKMEELRYRTLSVLLQERGRDHLKWTFKNTRTDEILVNEFKLRNYVENGDVLKEISATGVTFNPMNGEIFTVEMEKIGNDTLYDFLLNQEKYNLNRTFINTRTNQVLGHEDVLHEHVQIGDFLEEISATGVTFKCLDKTIFTKEMEELVNIALYHFLLKQKKYNPNRTFKNTRTGEILRHDNVVHKHVQQGDVLEEISATGVTFKCLDETIFTIGMEELVNNTLYHLLLKQKKYEPNRTFKNTRTGEILRHENVVHKHVQEGDVLEEIYHIDVLLTTSTDEEICESNMFNINVDVNATWQDLKDAVAKHIKFPANNFELQLCDEDKKMNVVSGADNYAQRLSHFHIDDYYRENEVDEEDDDPLRLPMCLVYLHNIHLHIEDIAKPHMIPYNRDNPITIMKKISEKALKKWNKNIQDPETEVLKRVGPLLFEMKKMKEGKTLEPGASLTKQGVRPNDHIELVRIKRRLTKQPNYKSNVKEKSSKRIKEQE